MAVCFASCRTFNPDDTTGNNSHFFPNYIQRQTAPLSELREGSGPDKLRLHANSGDLVELTNWRLDAATHEVHGIGTEYDRDRRVIRAITREDALPVEHYAQMQWDVKHDGGLTESGAVSIGLGVLYTAVIIASLALSAAATHNVY